MDVMRPEFRAQLLFFYPVPGDGRKCWRPSWDQVMTNKAIVDHFRLRTGWVHRTEDEDADYYMGCLIESGNVRGLSEVQKEEEPRRGELVFKDRTGAPHKLMIEDDHRHPIPDGMYTLIGSSSWIQKNWVVGCLREDGKFEKLSVFRSSYDEQLLRQKPLFEEQVRYLC